MATKSKKASKRATAKKATRKPQKKTAAAKKTAARKRSDKSRDEREDNQYMNTTHQGDTQRQFQGVPPWMRNQPPQRGYVAPNVAHYMVEPNSGSNAGGRAYGQSYVPSPGDRRNYRDYRDADQDYQNGQQDAYAGGRSSGDSFAQTYGQHRGGYDSHNQERYDRENDHFGHGEMRHYDRDHGRDDNRYQDAYDGRNEGNAYRGEGPDHGDPRYGGREYHGGLMGHNRRENWNDAHRNHPREQHYLHDRWEGDGNGRNNDPSEYEYRHDGYQSSGNVEGFGWRKSRRHQGGWLGEEEYRGGHGQNFRGRGKYGSR